MDLKFPETPFVSYAAKDLIGKVNIKNLGRSLFLGMGGGGLNFKP